ncbi:MAG: TIM barrel protein [Balneolales bacterium]
MNRKEWAQLTFGGMAGMMIPSGLADVFSTRVKGSSVILGAQTYSFRGMNLDDTLRGMNELGLTSCELWEGHVVPLKIFRNRPALAKWRTSPDSMAEIEAVRQKFEKAGITIQAYTVNMKDNITDEQLDHIFRMTKALGTDTITSSATVSVMPRLDVYAQKYGIYVAMHNHAHVDRPNEFSNPDSFARGMEGRSDFIRINLDIGHATAANYDPASYMKMMHEKIMCIHVKDRKKNNGPRTYFGEGDTPIREVLQLIRDNQWPIPANIELEYEGNTMTEMKRCVDYCRKVLAE